MRKTQVGIPMQSNPQSDPMKTILELAGKDPSLLRTLGRFAGQLYGGDSNHFQECLGKVAQELMGNLANMQALVTRGNACAN